MQISSDVLQTVPIENAGRTFPVDRERGISRNRRYDQLHSVHINSTFHHKSRKEQKYETILVRTFQETSKGMMLLANNT